MSKSEGKKASAAKASKDSSANASNDSPTKATKQHASAETGDARTLPADAAAKLQKNATIAAVVGLACTGAAFALDKHRFGYSYLVGFAFVATIGLGALFFVLVQHLTRAGWSVTARRHMEYIASGILPFTVLLFAPVAVLAHDIFHNWMSDHVSEAIEKKRAYLNPQFFFIRAAIFFGVWTLLSLWFAARSREQDGKPNDTALTRKMQAVSAPAMFAFAFSLTFAAFDWLMSLDPHWFSTIFGVYVFAGSVTSSLSVLALITMALQKNGWLKKASTVEHRHDIGKLMFAFTVFWTYIAFSQYFLIWYANIPEETEWYKLRWEGAWRNVSLALVFMQFVIPFWVLLSRHTKRSYRGLTIGAIILLVAHYIDLYWLVMPTLGDAGATPSIVDVLALLGPLGVGAFLVSRVLAKGPLFPVGDPRLAESMKLENL
jgi:hypothetical protein